MSEADQQKEIDRILALPEKVDPFTVLGITVFISREEAAAAAAAKQSSDSSSVHQKTEKENTNANGSANATSSTATSSGSSKAPPLIAKKKSDEEEPDFVRVPIELRDVTRAYRRLNLLLHPDKCSLDRAGDALHRVAEANKKLPSEVTVERFLIELERMKRRDWDMARRRAQAEEERKRKIAARGGGKSVVGGMGEEGNGIANFNNMTMVQKIEAVAELERAERLAELSKKADAIAKKQAEEKAKAEEARLRGEELMRQAEEWAGYMEL